MLLQCDNCQEKFSELAKIPCGFFVEKQGARIIFVMPTDEESYRNICIKCLLIQLEKE